jgi:hypothetical protein
MLIDKLHVVGAEGNLDGGLHRPLFLAVVNNAHASDEHHRRWPVTVE